jgi:hypothetical protein
MSRTRVSRSRAALLVTLLACWSVRHAAAADAPKRDEHAKPAPFKVVNVLDFGATPDDDTDDTAAIQAAIDSLPKGVALGSNHPRAGGIVYFPAGQYRIGGAPGRCTGASQGTPCRDDRPCSGGPPAGSCAAIISGGHQVRLLGAGPWATEIVLVGSDDMDGIAISPGDDLASIEDLRVAKVSHPKVGTGNGIVVQGQRTMLRDLTVGGWGAAGVFVNGEQAVAKANSCRFDRVESDGNGGDGFRIWSHNDGSMHTITGCNAQGNGGWGFSVESSKSVLVGLETNNNKAGAVRVAGSHNLLTSYFEIANQPTCIRFDEGASYNVFFDMSGCTVKAEKLADHGRNNQVHVNGAWNAIGYTPTDTPGTCDAARRGWTYYDDSLGRICFCERREKDFRWCPVDGSPCKGNATGCD